MHAACEAVEAGERIGSRVRGDSRCHTHVEICEAFERFVSFYIDRHIQCAIFAGLHTRKQAIKY